MYDDYKKLIQKYIEKLFNYNHIENKKENMDNNQYK